MGFHVGRMLANVGGDAPVARVNERRRTLAVVEICVDGCRQRRAGEVVKRREELERGSALVHQVLQVKEVRVAGEVAEQSEEVRVPGKHVAQRAGLLHVMPADALHR
jgi:hypothetical protein